MRRHVSRTVRLERFENGVNVGTPDVQALYTGFVTWCELKSIVVVPRRKTTPLLGNEHGLSIDQRNWHFDWTAHGGRSCVIVGVGSDQTILIIGSWIESANVMNLEEYSDCATAIGWPAIEVYLQGHDPQ